VGGGTGEEEGAVEPACSSEGRCHEKCSFAFRTVIKEALESVSLSALPAPCIFPLPPAPPPPFVPPHHCHKKGSKGRGREGERE